MKQRDLIKRLRAIAAAKGHDLELHREGSEHTIYRIGTAKIPIPRHREINELTATRILRDAEKI